MCTFIALAAFMKGVIMKNTRKKQNKPDETTKEQAELFKHEIAILEIFRKLDDKTKFYIALYCEVSRISGYTNSKLPEHLYKEFRDFNPTKSLSGLDWLRGAFEEIQMINVCS